MYTLLKNWYMRRTLSKCVLVGCERCKTPFLVHIHQLDFDMGQPYTNCPSCGLEITLQKGQNMLFVRYVNE